MTRLQNCCVVAASGLTAPTPIDFSQPVITPDFETGSGFGCMPPRDVLLTVGNEILEATMSYRCRWFEYLCYRPLLKRYWEEDPNFRHEAAPKPRLTDSDYRPDYLSGNISIETRLEWTAEKFFVTTEEEPLFDAAGCLAIRKGSGCTARVHDQPEGNRMDSAPFSGTQGTCGQFSGRPVPDSYRCDLHSDQARSHPEQSRTPFTLTIREHCSQGTTGKSSMLPALPTIRPRRCAIRRHGCR